MSDAREANSMSRTALCGVVLGCLFGGLTFALPTLSSISDNPIIGTVQRCTVALLVPGMIGAAAASGNVHAWPMWLAAGLNMALYFAIGWLACWVGLRLLRRRP